MPLFNSRFSVSKRSTRNNSDLDLPKCRLATGKRSFAFRGSKGFNTLPKDTKVYQGSKGFQAQGVRPPQYERLGFKNVLLFYLYFVHLFCSYLSIFIVIRAE